MRSRPCASHDEKVEILCLQPDGAYAPRTSSPLLPQLPPQMLLDYLRMTPATVTSDILRLFRRDLRRLLEQA